MQQADACQEIAEMNHVAALLRRHGYLLMPTSLINPSGAMSTRHGRPMTR